MKHRQRSFSSPVTFFRPEKTEPQLYSTDSGRVLDEQSKMMLQNAALAAGFVVNIKGAYR